MAGLSNCVLRVAGQAQSSRTPSRQACRPCTRTSCSAQQQHSLDQHCGPSHQSSLHHPHGSHQRPGTSQEQGPDISLLSPVLQRQWDHAKNAHYGNILIRPYSNRKPWWQCNQCPLGHRHAWQARIDQRSNGTSCPFCTSQKVCQHNSLATKHPDVAVEFSDRNQGTAHDYTAGSGEEVFWRCNFGHDYIASVKCRTVQKGGCPECFAARQLSQPKQKHPVLADSRHAMLQYWDSELNGKEGLKLNKIRCRSNKLCNWVCHCCPRGQPHRWQACPNTLYRGHRCPCCSGHQACICNSLESLFPDIAAEWDYTRNTGTPDDYSAGSNSKVWWVSQKRGSFQTRIRRRTHVQKQFPGI